MKDFARENWAILIDVAVVGFLTLISWFAWAGYSPSPALMTRMQEYGERGLALDSVSGGISGAITGASIILGVIGAIAGLGRDLPPQARAHLKFGAVDCGVSLLVGVWAATRLPQYVGENLSLVTGIGVALALQGYAMFAATARLLLGTWHIFSTKGAANSAEGTR